MPSRKRRPDYSSLLHRLGQSRSIQVLVMIELLAAAGGVYYCILILSFSLGTPANDVTPIPIEETLEMPLNCEEPVYTENKYSDWVAISISGSIERNGEFLFDALHHNDDLAKGSQGGFRGFMIDGRYVYFMLTPTPDYRDDHVYRFPYSVYRNIRDTNLHLPKTLGFQIEHEFARGLVGEFIVEVSSDSFKYWPESRGR